MMPPSQRLFHLLEVDERLFQFNFTSDLEISSFSIYKKQRKSQDRVETALSHTEKQSLHRKREDGGGELRKPYPRGKGYREEEGCWRRGT